MKRAAFVGLKMLAVDLFKVPTVWSLGVIGLRVGGSVAASLLWPKPKAGLAGEEA